MDVADPVRHDRGTVFEDLLLVEPPRLHLALLVEGRAGLDQLLELLLDGLVLLALFLVEHDCPRISACAEDRADGVAGARIPFRPCVIGHAETHRGGGTSLPRRGPRTEAAEARCAAGPARAPGFTDLADR